MVLQSFITMLLVSAHIFSTSQDSKSLNRCISMQIKRRSQQKIEIIAKVCFRFHCRATSKCCLLDLLFLSWKHRVKFVNPTLPWTRKRWLCWPGLSLPWIRLLLWKRKSKRLLVSYMIIWCCKSTRLVSEVCRTCQVLASMLLPRYKKLYPRVSSSREFMHQSCNDPLPTLAGNVGIRNAWFPKFRLPGAHFAMLYILLYA